MADPVSEHIVELPPPPIPVLSTGKRARQKRTLPDVLRPHVWKPGQSGNPGGRVLKHGDVIKLARAGSVDAAKRLIEIATDPTRPDDRAQVVAIKEVLSLCRWPADAAGLDQPRADLSALSPKELEQFAKLLGKAAKAGGFPAAPTTEEGEK